MLLEPDFALPSLASQIAWFILAILLGMIAYYMLMPIITRIRLFWLAIIIAWRTAKLKVALQDLKMKQEQIEIFIAFLDKVSKSHADNLIANDGKLNQEAFDKDLARLQDEFETALTKTDK